MDHGEMVIDINASSVLIPIIAVGIIVFFSMVVYLSLNAVLGKKK